MPRHQPEKMEKSHAVPLRLDPSLGQSARSSFHAKEKHSWRMGVVSRSPGHVFAISQQMLRGKELSHRGSFHGSTDQ